MIYTPKRISLPKSGNFRRVPPRRPDDRQENYIERFDFDTVFSDVFIQDGRVWMVAPPFLNLQMELEASKFVWNFKDVSNNIHFENLNRMSRASFPVEDENGRLDIDSTLGRWTINVERVRTAELDGANALVTQQQDNRLEWIAYWAFFNSQINGIDSVVIYDNCSSLYSAETVDQILGKIPGIRNHIVVKWDTPYGAPGGPNSVWDSDYGQHISWEHARRTFLREAATACIIDVDELPVSLSGNPVAQLVRESSNPVLLFRRQPIRQYRNRTQRDGKLRVHRDFSLGETRGAWLAEKYAFSPSRLPESSQLLVHQVLGGDFERSTDASVIAGHFDGIRVRWRKGEKHQAPVFTDRSQIVEPVEENAAFERAFSSIDEKWVDLSKELEPFFRLQKDPS